MNILFCSIEGVLFTNTFKYKLLQEKGIEFSYGKNCILDPQKVDLLNKYCWENKIYVVFLCIWAKTMTFENCIKNMQSKGIKIPVLGMESLFNESNLEEVINTWLIENKKKWKSEIKWNAIAHYNSLKNYNDLYNIKITKDKPIVYCSIDGLTEEVIKKIKL